MSRIFAEKWGFVWIFFATEGGFDNLTEMCYTFTKNKIGFQERIRRISSFCRPRGDEEEK